MCDLSWAESNIDMEFQQKSLGLRANGFHMYNAFPLLTFDIFRT